MGIIEIVISFGLALVGGMIGLFVGRLRGRREGRREAEREAMEDTIERTERGRAAVSAGRASGDDPVERLRRNDGQW